VPPRRWKEFQISTNHFRLSTVNNEEKGEKYTHVNLEERGRGSKYLREYKCMQINEWERGK